MLSYQCALWKPPRCCVSSLSVRFGGHTVDFVAVLQQWQVPSGEGARQHNLWQPPFLCSSLPQWTCTGRRPHLMLSVKAPRPWIPPCSTFQQAWISYYREDKAGVLSYVTRDPSSKYKAQSLCCNLALTEAVNFLPRCVPAHSLFWCLQTMLANA